MRNMLEIQKGVDMKMQKYSERRRYESTQTGKWMNVNMNEDDDD